MTKEKPVIDVVIPAHQKDLATLEHAIDGVRKNIVGVRRIIVVSKEKYTDKAEWFDESKYPFSFQDISDLVNGSNVGWNFQQLLKLYAVLVIPDISKNVLIVDSDTIFFRKVKFFDNGLPLYNLSKDKNLEDSNFHQVTLRHIKKILPEIAKELPEKFDENTSGICHHMLFQKHMIEDLFLRVEKQDGSGDPFYKVFLKTCENSFGVAEYNLYFYFLICCHPDEYKIRILKYKNTSDFKKISLLKERLRYKYDYCSYHSYMREEDKSPSFFLTKFSQKIRNIFFFDQWNIGILGFPIEGVLKKDIKINWLKAPKNLDFYADPFCFEINDQKYIVFEEYKKELRHGIISIATINQNLELANKKVLLDDKKHLSYPYICQSEGRIFLICESYKADKLTLYEIDKKNLEAKKIKNIFTDQKIIDPTIIFYNQKFWLFYSSQNSDLELNISFADSLEGDFVKHSQNPVKKDVSSSRSAGTPFMIDGEIYRPSQNCSKTYGGSIVISKIIKLTENEFAEEFVKEILPNDRKYCDGIHTISSFGNFTLVDGKRKVFAISKPFISLFYKMKKLLVN